MYWEQTRNEYTENINILDYLHRTCRMGVCKTENLTIIIVAKDYW